MFKILVDLGSSLLCSVLHSLSLNSFDQLVVTWPSRPEIKQLSAPPTTPLLSSDWLSDYPAIHNDMQIENIENHVENISRKFFYKIPEHSNPLISSEGEYANKTGSILILTAQLNGPSHSSRLNCFFQSCNMRPLFYFTSIPPPIHLVIRPLN
ncbi:hypothetical protein AVEN_262756-1 [Araneus ventricosus]|uniref:Uncharacterized protein n=1 Tax=Araneus ventricosus TaxID=182803 RepID=A0A4Y2PVT5_ARAVE|nr:hypothetical protein AVEN_262756-1 [Araneus ventricosus]